MAEYFSSPKEFLVEIPEELAETDFLVEPVSNTEKAIEHARASRSAFTWEPETALVLGNGPLGLLTLARLAIDGDFSRTYCLGRRDRLDPTIEIIERLGGIYIDPHETPVAEVVAACEPMDFVYEATGYAPHAFATVDALAPNGLGVLLGIPDEHAFEVEGGRFHRQLVLENKALLGSVNSNVRQYEAAVESLSAFADWFADELITGVYPPWRSMRPSRPTVRAP